MYGINALIAVSSMQASNANDQALAGAAKQRSLLNQQKQLRDAQRHLESMTGGSGYGYGYLKRPPF
jgi:hypothetical protein